MTRPPHYHRDYMRPRRAWEREAKAIMRLPPGQRMQACMDLISRDFDEIMEDGAKRHYALMRQIRAAPDAGPGYHVAKRE